MFSQILYVVLDNFFDYDFGWSQICLCCLANCSDYEIACCQICLRFLANCMAYEIDWPQTTLYFFSQFRYGMTEMCYQSTSFIYIVYYILLYYNYIITSRYTNRPWRL